jgi:hypothetical protein
VSQISQVLRRTERGHAHWCPGCNEMHVIPSSWSFDGNAERPTFNPSVKISGHKRTRDADGKWNGGWERDAAGHAIPTICHYHLHAGVLKFCADSTHSLAGKSVALSALPPTPSNAAEFG